MEQRAFSLKEDRLLGGLTCSASLGGRQMRSGKFCVYGRCMAARRILIGKGPEERLSGVKEKERIFFRDTPEYGGRNVQKAYAGYPEDMEKAEADQHWVRLRLSSHVWREKLLPAVHAAMLDTIAFFRGLAVIEAVESTDEVAGDAADTLEFDIGSDKDLIGGSGHIGFAMDHENAP